MARIWLLHGTHYREASMGHIINERVGLVLMPASSPNHTHLRTSPARTSLVLPAINPCILNFSYTSTITALVALVATVVTALQINGDQGGIG